METTSAEASEQEPHSKKKIESVIRMSGFIESQILSLMNKLEELNLDECANECEKLHEKATLLSQNLKKSCE